MYEVTVTTALANKTDCLIASADRRPVDPPPVVELRVYEHQGDSKHDITFSHNANFFLYTTLESARSIAQGRGTAIPSSFPVLTGMPVAGMAYLDRPSPAGYFIFPDLSVRHEGKYRLSFNLYEELKEAKDADVNSPLTDPEHPHHSLMRSSPMAPQAHVHFRLEVKSEPFVVFSAKKFPGLAESTSLSRVVADQGCRVRIRRDVRMRRRDTKSNKDYDDYEDENSYARNQTPEAYPHNSFDRPRSISNVSGEMSSQYGSTEQRRQSVHDANYYAQNTHPVPSNPPPQGSTNTYQSFVSYGQPQPHPQYQASPIAMQAAHVSPPAQPFQTSVPPYVAQPMMPTRQGSSTQVYQYQQSPSYGQQTYPATQPYNDSEYRPNSDYRRSSNTANGSKFAVQPLSNHSSASDLRHPYSQPSQHPQAYSAHQPAEASRPVLPIEAPTLPPLKTIQPTVERKFDPASILSSASISNLVTSPTQEIQHQQYPTNVAPASAQAQVPQHRSSITSTIAPTSSSKRAFGKVFDSTHLKSSVRAGQRPDLENSHGMGLPQVEFDGTLVDDDEDDDDLESLKTLSYRRADGSRQMKKCPSPIMG